MSESYNYLQCGGYYRIVLQCIGSLRIVFHADDHRKCRVYSMGTISVNNLLNIGSLPLLCCEVFFVCCYFVVFIAGCGLLFQWCGCSCSAIFVYYTLSGAAIFPKNKRRLFALASITILILWGYCFSGVDVLVV